jgi:hypothetical protein
VADSTVLLGANDPVVIGQPNLSVVGAGRVVISAAATVIFVIATPLLVFTHKHMGVLRGMKSPVTVVDRSALTDALV